MEEQMEKAITQVLYRQSSLETRLSPIADSDISSSSEDDTVAAPRIIGAKLKANAIKSELKDENNAANKSDKFQTPTSLIKGK